MDRLLVSLEFIVFSMLLADPIAIPAGVSSASRPDTVFDHGAMTVGLRHCYQEVDSPANSWNPWRVGCLISGIPRADAGFTPAATMRCRSAGSTSRACSR